MIPITKEDFKKINDNNQTVIERVEETKKDISGWNYWGRRLNDEGVIEYVYRKVINLSDLEDEKLLN